jgi:hypothetical protein
MNSMDRKQMQEVINGMRNIVKPYLAKQLKKINFEGCGNTDKAEFETDFEIVLTLAEQALAIPSAEPSGDLISRQAAIKSIEERAKRIKNEDTLNGLAGAVGILFELPSVKPQPCEDAISRDFQIGDEVRMIGSDPIYDDCDVGWVIRNASERIKTMYVMRNDGSAGEEIKAEWYKTGRHNNVLAEVIKELPSVKQEPKTEHWKDFALWVASEIFDDWEYNKDAFAEIACRKLAKLGIVRAKGDEWELVEPQESEEV